MKYPQSFAIVGGGISGLSTAYYLRQARPDARIELFESGDRLGGVLQTHQVGRYLIEASADMFVTQPDAAWRLCCDLGIEDQLLTTREVPERAYIGIGEELFPVPQGLSMMVPTLREPILESNLLSNQGKQRFLSEHEIPPAGSDLQDESLKSFAVRRFGVEAYEKIIQPMVSGIYTADPDKLSMAATMKRFFEMEKRHGSLIAALASPDTTSQDQSASGAGMADKTASGARYGLFRAPQAGMQTLIDELVRQTTDLTFHTHAPVEKIQSLKSRQSTQTHWGVQRHSGDAQYFDGLVIATPAAKTAALLCDLDDAETMIDALKGIETASSAIVIMGIRRDQLHKNFEGFGIIYPHVDNGNVIAISFSSNKFSGRSGDDYVLIRCFIGGAMQSELVDLDDDALVDIATRQLDVSVGISGTPELQQVHRWRNCMPQYHLGHLERVAAIEAGISRLPNLELAGNSYWGVGIPACVESGKKAAHRVSGGG